MTRWISIVLLFIFTSCIVAISYGGFKKGNSMSITMVEEEETQHKLIEVKEFLPVNFTINNVFIDLEVLTKTIIFNPDKEYKEVFLNPAERPPNL